MLEQFPSGQWMANAPQAGLLEATIECDTLLAAIAAIERTMEQSAGRPAALASGLRASMGLVRDNLRLHVHQSESEHGLLPRVTEERPRFTRRAEGLRCEHELLQAQLDMLEAALASPAGEHEARRCAAGLLDQLRAHMEGGSRLLFDAYVRDTGIGD
jgi:hypothetical protein